MTNNTTFQRIFWIARAIVTGGAITSQAATATSHFETGGTFVCNGATPVTVTEPKVGAGSSVTITLKTVGGTVSPSVPYIATITPGTGFTVMGTALDTSTYNYLVVGS